MPVHHLLERILDEYIVAAGLQSGQPLFQSVNSVGTAVTGRALNRYNAWTAIRKRAKAAGFLTPVGCHTWRATGITIYLENDGRLEHAQQMAGHESPRTTKLYDRTKDEITLTEVERIACDVLISYVVATTLTGAKGFPSYGNRNKKNRSLLKPLVLEGKV